jgi:hypothetical protein
MAFGHFTVRELKYLSRWTMPIWTGRGDPQGQGKYTFIGQGADSARGHAVSRKQRGIPIFYEHVKMTGFSGSSPVRRWPQQLAVAHPPRTRTSLAYVNIVQANLPISGIDSVPTAL